MNFLAAWVWAAVSVSGLPADGGGSASDAGAAEPPVLEQIRTGAKAYEPAVKSPWVKQFLKAMAALPPQGKRTFFCTADKSHCFTDERPGHTRREADEDFYYGRIADGLGYARPLELLAARGFSPRGSRLLDFGYGNISQLEALVAIGAQVAGIEVDPVLPLLYQKADRPALRIHHGYFPSDPKLLAALGGRYDVFLSKNTLKRGYVHPVAALTAEQQNRTLKLAVSDEAFVARVFALLKPGGLFFIYNICPPEGPSDQPFVMASDGHSPFSKATYEEAGFEVLAFDASDDDAMRAMGKAYRWDGSETWVARYTLLRRPKQ